MFRERGSISAIVVGLTMSAVALAGLVFDGGNIVNVYSRLSDTAENTGRVGAQYVSGIRAGNPYINDDEARPAMKTFLQHCSCFSFFEINEKTVRVTLKKKVRFGIQSVLKATQMLPTAMVCTHSKSGCSIQENALISHILSKRKW